MIEADSAPPEGSQDRKGAVDILVLFRSVLENGQNSLGCVP